MQARHGTRAPTKKRIKELDRLASRLQELVRDVEELGLKDVPSWMRGWESPWKGKLKGGELVSLGEEELYNLGTRVRERFPDLFNEEYHPDVFLIRATQVRSHFESLTSSFLFWESNLYFGYVCQVFSLVYLV